MITAVDLRVIELLSARLCHELISPIAAVGNGVELLAEETPDFVSEAVALVAASARRAGRRLQFYRFAYGFGRGAALVGPPPHQLAGEFFDETRIVCDYAESARGLPLDQQKLACNLLVVGAEALPRGGNLVLGTGAAGPDLEGAGVGAGPSPDACAALALATSVAELTSRTVAAYFAGLLAAAVGCRLVVSAIEPGRFRLTAMPAAAPQRAT